MAQDKGFIHVAVWVSSTSRTGKRRSACDQLNQADYNVTEVCSDLGSGKLTNKHTLWTMWEIEINTSYKHPPDSRGERIFFCRVIFPCWLLFQYLFHPCVTTVTFKWSWQSAGKDKVGWLDGVRTHQEMILHATHKWMLVHSHFSSLVWTDP